MKKVMKKFIILSLLIVSMMPVMAQEKTYRLDVGRFDKVKITDNVNVVYRSVPDSTGMAVFTGKEEFANAFIFTNNKGKLRIQVNTEDVNNPELPTLYIYSDYITEIENSSEFTATVENTISVPTFSAKQIGNGKIVSSNIQAGSVNAHLATGKGDIILTGKANKATFKMVGTGMIQAEALEVFDVKCSILGTGGIYCWPVKKLDVRGVGTTKILYKGEPEIKKVGGGKVFPIADNAD